jgi:hypothetical protein
LYKNFTTQIFCLKISKEPVKILNTVEKSILNIPELRKTHVNLVATKEHKLHLQFEILYLLTLSIYLNCIKLAFGKIFTLKYLF